MTDFTARLAYKEDISGMYRIERNSFAVPWSLEAFTENFYGAFSIYALCEDGDGNILGFGGMQVIFDEAHIMNIAVDSDFRRQGIGDAILQLMMSEAKARNAETMFLEVRIGNDAAKALYRKHGFCELAVRKGYYSDNGEDAVIMTKKL